MRFTKTRIFQILPLLCLILILVLTNIPNPRFTGDIKINRGRSDQYSLELDLPEEIWNGQEEKIHLQFKRDIIEPESRTKDQEITAILARKIQNLEVDIILTGAILNPPGVSFTPILEDKDIMMNWRIKPLIAQDIQGSFWVFINTIQDGHEEENQRELIFTQEINIKNKLILGLKKSTIQWIITALIGLNLLILAKLNMKTPF